MMFKRFEIVTLLALIGIGLSGDAPVLVSPRTTPVIYLPDTDYNAFRATQRVQWGDKILCFSGRYVEDRHICLEDLVWYPSVLPVPQAPVQRRVTFEENLRSAKGDRLRPTYEPEESPRPNISTEIWSDSYKITISGPARDHLDGHRIAQAIYDALERLHKPKPASADQQELRSIDIRSFCWDSSMPPDACVFVPQRSAPGTTPPERRVQVATGNGKMTRMAIIAMRDLHVAEPPDSEQELDLLDVEESEEE